MPQSGHCSVVTCNVPWQTGHFEIKRFISITSFVNSISLDFVFVKNNIIGGEDVDIVIVQSMLLTGFDAPSLGVLYVDKPMKEHSLLQAIARVNRIAAGKDFGLIVDYWGLFGNLRTAQPETPALHPGKGHAKDGRAFARPLRGEYTDTPWLAILSVLCPVTPDVR